jgi:hypothetical protein
MIAGLGAREEEDERLEGELFSMAYSIVFTLD